MCVDDTPDTKEAYYYRRIFEQIFPDKSTRTTVSHWVPTWGASKDPSGRAQPEESLEQGYLPAETE